MDPVQNLVEQRLNHTLVDHNLLLIGLGRPVKFDNVLKTPD